MSEDLAVDRSLIANRSLIADEAAAFGPLIVDARPWPSSLQPIAVRA